MTTSTRARPAPLLEIRLFGQPQLARDGEPFRLKALPKALSLLAYVILSGEAAVSRDTLAFTHWPDDVEEVAHGKLRRHLHELQRALPPPPTGAWLQVEHDAVRWAGADDAWVDVFEFEQLARTPRTRARAVPLYRGDLLEPFYDDWVFPQRERLRATYLRLLRELALEHAGLRDFAPALDYASRLLTEEPWREDVVREAMTWRHESGDRAGALHIFDDFAARVRRDLGVEPMPETLALRERIVRNARLMLGAPADAPRPAEARRILLPFVGRAAELAQLRAAWQRGARGRGATVFISGEAGIGKSRLVEELSATVRMQGGRVLSGTATAPEPYAYAPLLDAVLDANTLSPNEATGSTADDDALRQRYFERFAAGLRTLAHTRPLLVVVEDVHWAGNATIALLEHLARRLAREPVLFVVTFREEEVNDGHPLRGARFRLGRDGVSAHVALRRFALEDVEAALRDRMKDAPDASAIVRRMYDRSEGLPLHLSELARDESVPDGGFAALIVARWNRIDDDARLLGEAAAVAGQSVDLDLLSDATGWRYERVHDALQQLLANALLAESGLEASVGYAFTHALVQTTVYQDIPPKRRAARHARIAQVLAQRPQAQVSAALVAAHYDRGLLPERAADWYLTAARRAAAVYAFQDAVAHAARGLELAVVPRVRAALLRVVDDAYAASGDREARLRVLEALEALAADAGARSDLAARRVRLHRAAGATDDERRALEELDAAAATADPEWQARALLERGLYSHMRGADRDALRFLEKARSRYEELGDADGALRACCGIVGSAVVVGELDLAARRLEEAESAAARSGERALVANTLRTAVTALQWRQEYGAARSIAERALAASLTAGDIEAEATAHEQLASLAARANRFTEASAHFDAALERYASVHSLRGRAAVSLNRGVFLTRVCRFDDAAASIAQSAAHFAALQDARGRATALLNTGMIAYYREDHAHAVACASEALDIARAQENRALEAIALNNLGAAERELGELDVALEHIHAGIDVARASSSRRVDAIIDLSDLALTYAAKEDDVSATRFAREAVEDLAASTDPPPYPHYVYWAAAVAHRRDDPEYARAMLVKARTAYDELVVALPDERARRAFATLWFNRRLHAADEPATRRAGR